MPITLRENVYNEIGDDVTLKYKTVASVGDFAGAEWAEYTVPFMSSGYVKIKIEA
jgi:hypothetical protein